MILKKIYETIISTLPETINNIEVEELSLNIPDHNYRNFFTDKAGREHYRLLVNIASLVSNEIIIDLGTHIGCSCLALASNKTNTVHSFDLVDRRMVNQPTDNCYFYVENILETENIQLFEKSSIIMLDTAHDGPFENAVYEYLKKINWKGILLLDDIYLNNAMISYWNEITHEKKEITNLGHFSGTGIVLFD